MKTNPLFFLFLLSSLLHSQDQSGLAPEVADLNAEDVSYENEKNLRYLEKPFFSTFPRNKSDQIQVGKFGADGGDKEKILAYARALGKPSDDEKSGNADSLLIAYRGKLIFESYFRRGRANFPHYQMSITKSYTAYALGRAIQMGYLSLQDLHKPVVSFLENLDSAKLVEGAEQITLNQAMQMSSGIRLQKNKITELAKKPELLRGQGQAQAYLQFSQPIPQPPQSFKYQAADTVLIMQVLDAVVPGSAERFIREELLMPMGIGNYRWQEDLSGLPKSAAGASFLSRDMIKIGLLTLQEGKWRGKQHIDKAFIIRAVAPHVETSDGTYYGYFWWSQNKKIGGKKYNIIQGRGAGGQFIFVFPTLDLVAVATAHNKGMGRMLKELPETLVDAFE